jgi:hypothetical protein
MSEKQLGILTKIMGGGGLAIILHVDWKLAVGVALLTFAQGIDLILINHQNY